LSAAGRWFSPCTPGSSTNKTDLHDITEILLKVALNTIKSKQTNQVCEIVVRTISRLYKQDKHRQTIPLPHSGMTCLHYLLYYIKVSLSNVK